MSESNVDAITSILALPQVFIYENIIFHLEMSLGVDEVLLAYVVDTVTPSSKYYLGEPQQKTWANPNFEKPTRYLLYKRYIKTNFDLWVAALELEQALVERDIIPGEKQQQ